MADKYDTYLTILHKLRQIKGILRQPSYRATLKSLQNELSNSIRAPHPYRLVVNKTVDQFKPLLGVPEFRIGGQGPPATHHSDYIYHLTSVRKMVGLSSTLTWTYFPPAFPNPYESDRKLFECLLKAYKDIYGGRGYMPLKNYATGRYSVKRDFTWWTNWKFSDARIVCDAHKVGMPNTWIPKYALVMRCFTKNVIGTLSHVPTVLDGFISEIFSPSDYGNAPPICGETINLDNPLLSKGEEEYSLNPIAVEYIQFYPILINNRKRRAHAVSRNARLWQLLEIYYQNL